MALGTKDTIVVHLDRYESSKKKKASLSNTKARECVERADQETRKRLFGMLTSIEDHKMYKVKPDELRRLVEMQVCCVFETLRSRIC
jgi:hypothetical protein